MIRPSEPGDSSAGRISDAEWTVAQVLWEKSPQTASEIIDALRDKTDWNPKTVHTLIRRLKQKGIINSVPDETPYRYYPLVSEQVLLHEKTRSLIDRVYGGSLSLMLSSFIREERLSEKELGELRKILDQKPETEKK